jgi:PAS domain S-box-containing protein
LPLFLLALILTPVNWLEEVMAGDDSSPHRCFDMVQFQALTTEPAQIDAVLREIARGVSTATHATFFDSLVQHLAESFEVDYAFIGEMTGPSSGLGDVPVQTVALWAQGQLAENFEYHPEPPCMQVVSSGQLCCYPSQIQRLFPTNSWLQAWNLESYVGMPLIGSNGQVLGLMAVMGQRPLRQPQLAESILQIFAVRVAAELERRRAETALRESEARYRSISELIEAYAYAFAVQPNGELRLEWVTDGFTTLTGFTLGEVETKGWKRLIYPDDLAIVEQQFQLIQSGQPSRSEYRVFTKSGVLLWLRAYGYPEWDESQSQVIRIRGAILDITEQKQVESQLQALNANLEQQVQERTVQLQQEMQKLQQLSQLKDDFLSTVSHELRSPLTNMKMAIHVLQELQTSAEQRQHYLQILQSECQRETNLINDLLDLQRLEVEGNPLQLKPLWLSDWLPGILEPFESRAQKAQQVLQLELPAKLPEIVSDRSSLERIVVELLNNACKYTGVGGTITVKVQPYPIERGGEGISLSVRNEATIPIEELPRVFDKFYRIPCADRWKQGGTGLGLALAKKLVERLGGIIRVESQAGETCFSVQLPSLSVGC